MADRELMEWLQVHNTVIPDYKLYELLRGLEGLHQLNPKTVVRIVNSRQHRIPIPSEIERYTPQETKRFEMIPITGWHYAGFIALLWRVWKAVVPKAPIHGWRVYQTVSYDYPPIAPPTNTKTVHLQLYGGDYYGVQFRLYAGYEPCTDTLLVKSFEVRDNPDRFWYSEGNLPPPPMP